MKFMRLAACAVAFAVVGGMAVAEDMDIKALQAKLAAQEARLNDLQAKMGSGAAEAPAAIMSINKNAKVTIGGVVDTRYVYDSIRIDEAHGGLPVGDHPVYGTDDYYSAPNNGTFDHWADPKQNKGDLFIDGTKVSVKIDVNENFDAFINLNTKDHGTDTGIAENAWIRWKNICNSGWGVLVGRDGLKFGMGNPAGMFDNWLQDNGSRTIYGQATAPHLNYGVGRITQINPYWENCDASLRFDLSFFQTVESQSASVVDGDDGNGAWISREGDLETTNYGLGSGTLKMTWKPSEDWTVVAAVANLYADFDDDEANQVKQHLNDGKGSVGSFAPVVMSLTSGEYSKNNTALHLGVTYNPAAFCKKLTLWAQGTREWNGGFIDGADFLALNAGIAYAFTDKLSAYVRGDYVDFDHDQYELSGWRSDIGMKYDFGTGLDFMLGWAHERVEREDGNFTFQKATGDTIYSRLAFSF